MIMDKGLIVADGSPQELKRQALGDSVLLSVAGDASSGQQALAVLQGAPFVREASADGTDLRLYVEHGQAALPQMLRTLEAEMITVRTVSISEPTLDDVFLAKTGRSLRDDQSAPMPEQERVA